MSVEAVREEAVPKPDWRDSLALAADLALLGVLTAVACLPVVTAGAALDTASVAADHACTHPSLPPVALLGRTFRRALLPGPAAVTGFVVIAVVVSLDLRAVAVGRVPGGVPVLIATAAIALAGLTLALLTLVRVGATGGQGWRAALGWAGRALRARPQVGLAVLATSAVPVLLAAAIPVLALLLPGLWLFALHVTVRRIS